ncbi:uncharacterized protein LOC135390589 [Ornithodoros turicata]|uniref:uncharacterized protein LOC135390589 n=1 Tax=Ornithodoros turicata TaxID=34597 RepID=UPI003138B5DE
MDMSSPESGCNALLALKNSALNIMKKMLDRKNEEEVRIRVTEKHLGELHSNIKMEGEKIKNLEAELQSEKRYLENSETTLNTLQNSHDSLEQQVGELEEQLVRERKATIREKDDCDTFMNNVRTDYNKQLELICSIKDSFGILQFERNVESLKGSHTEKMRYLQRLRAEIDHLKEHKNFSKSDDQNQFIVQLAKTKLNTEKLREELSKEEREIVSLQTTRDELLKQKEHEKTLATRMKTTSSLQIPALPKLRRFEMPSLLPKCSFPSTASRTAPMPTKAINFRLPALKPFSRSKLPAISSTMAEQIVQRVAAVQPKSAFNVQGIKSSNHQEEAATEKLGHYTVRRDTQRTSPLLKRTPLDKIGDTLKSEKRQKVDQEVQDGTTSQNRTLQACKVNGGNILEEPQPSAAPQYKPDSNTVVGSVDNVGSPLPSSPSMSQSQYLALLRTAPESPESRERGTAGREPLLLWTTSTPKGHHTTQNEDEALPTHRSFGGESDIFAELEDTRPQTPAEQFNMFGDTDEDKAGGSVAFAFTFTGSRKSGPTTLF